MEDIEDMIGDFGGVLLGLYLFKIDFMFGLGCCNGINVVIIKLWCRILVYLGGVWDVVLNLLMCVDIVGEMMFVLDKVFGMEVSVVFCFCEIRSCF